MCLTINKGWLYGQPLFPSQRYNTSFAEKLLVNCQHMRLVYLFFLLSIMLLAFCTPFKTLEGRVHPVYLTADSSLFESAGLSYPCVAYYINENLEGGDLQVVELIPRERVVIYIKKPTFLLFNGIWNLVYPNEDLVLKIEDNELKTYAVNSDQRTKEFRILKQFQEFERKLVVPNPIEYDLASILNIEKREKENIINAEKYGRQLYDSLCKTYDASKRFKKHTKNYIQYRYDLNLIWLFRQYKDTLKAHNLYKPKFDEFLSVLNSIKKRQEFNENLQRLLNSIIVEVFPEISISNIRNESDFTKCFDTIAKYFTGVPRDYLLSRIVYQAIKRKIVIPRLYQLKYSKLVKYRNYKRIIRNAKRQNKNEEVIDADNFLYFPDGKTKTTLSTVLKEQKGKVILIDVWASWCGPCLLELPFLDSLKQKYSQEKFVVVSLSVDKEIRRWKNIIIERGLEKVNQYLFVNNWNSAFAKEFEVNTVPRYILVDKMGEIVHYNISSVTDSTVKTILDKLLQ